MTRSHLIYTAQGILLYPELIDPGSSASECMAKKLCPQFNFCCHQLWTTYQISASLCGFALWTTVQSIGCKMGGVCHWYCPPVHVFSSPFTELHKTKSVLVLYVHVMFASQTCNFCEFLAWVLSVSELKDHVSLIKVFKGPSSKINVKNNWKNCCLSCFHLPLWINQ